MLSFNGHAACMVRVAHSDTIFDDLPSQRGSCGQIRRALYYRGYLVWKDGDGWSLSQAYKHSEHRAFGANATVRVYGQCGNAYAGTYAFGFSTRRETLEAIDRRHASLRAVVADDLVAG